MKTNDGGPAFPKIESIEHPDNVMMALDVHTVGGMSLRDWFAGQSLCGILANPNSFSSTMLLEHVATRRAIAAYAYADAMIAMGRGAK